MNNQTISRIAHEYIDELEWCPLHMADDAPFDTNGIEVEDVAEICASIDAEYGVKMDVTRWAYYPNSIRDLCDLYMGRERSVDVWKDMDVKFEHYGERKKSWWQRLKDILK